MRKGLLFLVISSIIVLLFSGCATFETTHPGEILTPSEWRQIPVGSADYERAWKVITDVISEKYSLEVVDKEGGYLKTEWVDETAVGAQHVPGMVYAPCMLRTTCKIEKAPITLKIKMEAKIQINGEWVQGQIREAGRKCLDEIVEEIQHRLNQ